MHSRPNFLRTIRLSAICAATIFSLVGCAAQQKPQEPHYSFEDAVNQLTIYPDNRIVIDLGGPLGGYVAWTKNKDDVAAIYLHGKAYNLKDVKTIQRVRKPKGEYGLLVTFKDGKTEDLTPREMYHKNEGRIIVCRPVRQCEFSSSQQVIKTIRRAALLDQNFPGSLERSIENSDSILRNDSDKITISDNPSDIDKLQAQLQEMDKLHDKLVKKYREIGKRRMEKYGRTLTRFIQINGEDFYNDCRRYNEDASGRKLSSYYAGDSTSWLYDQCGRAGVQNTHGLYNKNWHLVHQEQDCGCQALQEIERGGR